MQISVTWFDGVTQRVDLDEEHHPEPHLFVRRADQRGKSTCIRVGRCTDGTPRYVEDASGHAATPPRGSYLQ